MVHSVPNKPHEKKRRRLEAMFPTLRTLKAHCFNWPDGEPTILFVRDKRGEYSARIQNVELRVWPLGYEINTWSEEIVEGEVS